MIDKKRNNLLRELRTCFIKDKYEKFITQKVDWLGSLGINILLLSTRFAIEAEEVSYGGKVCWEKDSNPKKPLSLMLNIVDFQDIEFIAILLHECGHIKDKDDSSIQLQTLESEISAWSHAIGDFERLDSDEIEREKFSAIMKKALTAYKVDESTIQKMTFRIGATSL